MERVHQLARHGTGTYLWGRRRGRGASEKREKSATTTTMTTTKEVPLGDQRMQTCAHLLDLGQPEVEGGVQPTEELSSPHKIRPPGLVHLVRPDSDTTTTPFLSFPSARSALPLECLRLWHRTHSLLRLLCALLSYTSPRAVVSRFQKKSIQRLSDLLKNTKFPPEMFTYSDRGEFILAS